MLKIKSSRISALLIVAGLLSLSVFLAACDTASESAEIAFGLRTEAPGSLVETGDAAMNEISEPATSAIGKPPLAISGEPLADVVATGGNYGNQARTADRSDHTFDPTTAVEPSAEELEGLVYMREEEKLARDVYLALYDLWGMPVFQNIAGSEQIHMDSVLMLLEQYEMADPAAGMGIGEFTNPEFQSLYNDLVEQGSLSVSDALTVGATIEDLDIFDLQTLLVQTDNEYIVQVYSNLLAGSENHLRAFVSNLERQTGEGYQPVYISQNAYQAIMDGAADRGNGNGGFGGGNSGGGNGGNGRRNGQGGNA